ncbi:MAG: hypothetical protein ACR2N7_11880 [Acidimicrobiia bacterium]
MSESFTGGMNHVRRVGDTVVRPSASHTPAVHAFLRHLRDNGFESGPAVVSIDMESGTETLSWVEGDVPLYPAARSPRIRS